MKNLAATPLTSLQEALCWPLTIVLSRQPASVAPWLLLLSQVQWRHRCQPDIQRQLKVPSFYSAGKEFYGLLILWWKINLVLKLGCYLNKRKKLKSPLIKNHPFFSFLPKTQVTVEIARLK